MSGPLSGLKVVDFSRVLAGPLCARTLADLGAEVIKVEPPRADASRFSAPYRANGVTGYFAQQNTGKRNISIDLNKESARAIAIKLCEDADIVIENFRPGALAAFGLDYESLSARNPKLVYVSISGYGQAGPWSRRMAYAPTIQAEAGFTFHSRRHFGENLAAPQTDALSHADVYTGLQGVIAVLSAIHSRSVTGRGQYVDVCMLATMMSINEHAHIDLNGLDTGDEPAILGATSGSFFSGPNGEQFISATSLVSTITFQFFIAAMRRPDLADDPRFRTATDRKTNLEALTKIVQAWIYTFPDLASLDAQLDEAKIAMGEVKSLSEVATSDWAEYWGATHAVSDRADGTYNLPSRPWKFSSGDLPEPGDPALQGEHNAEICGEYGYSNDEIAQMTENGALIGNFAAVISSLIIDRVGDVYNQSKAEESPRGEQG